MRLTLLDVANRYGLAEEAVAEVLTGSSSVLKDAVFVEGNTSVGHRVSIRAALPPVYWRGLNQGIPPSKSQTYVLDEVCGILEGYSQIDADLAALSGDISALRLSEDAAFLEAMTQAQTKAFFYGDPCEDPRQFLGLSARYSAKNDANNSKNVIDAGGKSLTNASIWLVFWSPYTVFCTFPKGSKAGLVVNDNGVVTLTDDDGHLFRVYQSHYQWKTGLVVKDWRYVVRVANIDMVKNPNTNILELMAKALNKIPNCGSACRPAFYVNPEVFERLIIHTVQDPYDCLTIQTAPVADGIKKAELYFLGIPVHRVSELTNNEPRVQ